MSHVNFKSYITVALMKINEPVTENNIQGQSIAEPSTQVKFHSNPNNGWSSKNALAMEILIDNIGQVIVKEENKTRRWCRICKNIHVCQMSSASSH